MKVSDTVRATTNVNVRAEPNLKAPVTSRFVLGEQRVILGGPSHGDGLTWWKFKLGWAAEVAPDKTILLELVERANKWERSIAFILKEEGSYNGLQSDPGNWTGGKVGVGYFRGTKFGISAASYPTLNILDLTREQATDIFERDFWPVAQGFEWPLCLAVLDLAVNGGKGRAAQALAAAGPDFSALMGWRILWYCNLLDYPKFGQGWIRRCGRLLAEAADPL